LEDYCKTNFIYNYIIAVFAAFLVKIKYLLESVKIIIIVMNKIQIIIESGYGIGEKQIYDYHNPTPSPNGDLLKKTFFMNNFKTISLYYLKYLCIRYW